MYFAKLNSFYITVLFIIALCFIYIVFFYTLIPLIKNVITKNNLIKCFKEKNTDYEVRKKTSNEYDYSLIINNQEYFIKLVDIKKDSDIQISTNKTLVVLRKTLTNALRSTELVEVKEFIESSKSNKIILLNAKVNKITLIKSENEVIELKIGDKVYNTMIIDNKNLNLIIKK